MSEATKAAAFQFPEVLEVSRSRRYPRDALCGYSSLNFSEAEVETFLRRVPEGLDGPEDRALGA